jgi:hypothetical protein
MIVLIKLALAVQWFSGLIPFVAYIVFGIGLNRVVLRALVYWHPVNATIDNVSGSKLRAMIFWPLAYPVLFFKLGVMKHL